MSSGEPWTTGKRLWTELIRVERRRSLSHEASARSCQSCSAARRSSSPALSCLALGLCAGPGGREYGILSVYLGVLAEARFEGSGCAISKSSASLMTSMVRGKSPAEAELLFGIFHRLVTGEKVSPAEMEKLGKLAVFAKVSEFPARVKCASLAWHTLHAAVTSGETTVSTE